MIAEIRIPEAPAAAHDVHADPGRGDALHASGRAGCSPIGARSTASVPTYRLEAALPVGSTSISPPRQSALETGRGLRSAVRRAWTCCLSRSCGGEPASAHRLPRNRTWTAWEELRDAYTVPENLLGVPACAIRAGFDSSPASRSGFSWSEGPAGGDATVLAVAQAFYEATAELGRPDGPGNWTSGLRRDPGTAPSCCIIARREEHVFFVGDLPSLAPEEAHSPGREAPPERRGASSRKMSCCVPLKS